MSRERGAGAAAARPARLDRACSARARRARRPVRARRRDRRDRAQLPASARSATRSPTRTPARSRRRSTSSPPPTSEAGVAAWTVWVPEFDREAIALLEAAGHGSTARRRRCRSSSPPSSRLDLGDLDWDRDADPGRPRPAQRPRLRAARATPGSPPALAGPPDAPAPPLPGRGSTASRLRARRRSTTATTSASTSSPPIRTTAASGLASRLMSVALVEGRDRGLETSSLQASPMGRPVYARLGYAERLRA